MIRNSLTLILSLLITFYMQAQNLVYNPSFEETDTCYSHCENGTLDLIPNAIGWFNPTLQTPDIFSSCNYPNPFPQTILDQYICQFQCSPFNWQGYQYPLSGNNYAGIGVLMVDIQSNSINECCYQEYLGGELISPLSNKYYCVSLNISQSSILYYKYIMSQNNFLYSVINKIGLNFSNQKQFYNTTSNIFLEPSVTFTPEIGGYFLDTLNWEKVIMPYKASGGERYFIIGNFYHENDIQFQVVTNFDVTNPEFQYTTAGCYLYLEDVEVIQIPELELSSDTSIYFGTTIQISTSTFTDGLEWFEGDTLQSLGGGNAISVSPEKTTTYYLKANQCKLITWDTVNVTVIPKPIIPVSISFLNTITETQFQIQYTGDYKPVLDVELFNSVGQLVKVLQISETTPISLENVSSGIYYCRLSKDRIPIMTGKVVKVN